MWCWKRGSALAATTVDNGLKTKKAKATGLHILYTMLTRFSIRSSEYRPVPSHSNNHFGTVAYIPWTHPNQRSEHHRS